MSACKRIFADLSQINNCREIIKENQQSFSELSQVVALAGNEVRLKILFLLDQEHELCPCDLSDILEMKIPAISQHLHKLKNGSVIQSRKSGQTIFYSVCPSQLHLLKPLFSIIKNSISNNTSMKNAIQKSWISGILAAIAASLCCIAPLLAVFGGISGAATYFNWMEPFRPYMIGLTILVFAIIWYQQLATRQEQQVDCCEPEKRSFWQSKKFLLIVTLCSGMLIAFPYYSSLFYRTPQPSAAAISQARFSYVKWNIKGMSCADCTKHIDGSLLEINGVATSRTSFEKSETIVRYDPAKTNADSINHKIKEIGYQPTLIKKN